MAVNPYDVYLAMESAWLASIPKGLQGMRPKELVTLMRLAGAGEGVSQGDAASALGQSPSGISRITAKLLERKWVTVERSTDNHKQKLITATSKARLAMNALEGKLAAAMQATVAPLARTKTDKNADAVRRLYGPRTLFTTSIEGEET
jgi:DNA-binding MarR family transcriptional regulator